MEPLSKLFAKYFYIILLISMIFYLFDAVYIVLHGGDRPEVFLQICVLFVNIMLLGNSIKFNIHQQFTECKNNAQVLRITIALTAILQIVCGWTTMSVLAARNCIMCLIVTELVLKHRISCIEHLERLANQYAKADLLGEKEGK